MQCEINDAHLFLQVIREKRDPRSLLREAISNAWDAGASRVRVQLNPLSKDTLDLVIEDNGAGIPRQRFRHFFGLGMSTKSGNQAGIIGNKGLGTKLYFNSKSITVSTRPQKGAHLVATLEDPVAELTEGRLPAFTVRKQKVNLPFKSGTRVEIKGIPVNTQSPLLSVDGITNYLRWYSMAGSARRIFGHGARNFRVDVTRNHVNRPPSHETVQGHLLPEIPAPPKQGQPMDPADFVAHFEPFTFWARDESGKWLTKVDIAGAVVGANGHVVKDRRIKKKFKGVFLCRDFFAVRGINEEVTGNSGEWQSFHILVNCQDLQLTMSREDFIDTGDGSVYSAVIRAVREFLNCALRGERFTYFGEVIEKSEAYAGKAYKELQQCKAEWTQSEAHNRVTFAVLDLSGRRELPPNLHGGPYFEPQEKIGTLLVFQSLLANSAYGSTAWDLSQQYRLLSFTPEQGGMLLIQNNEDGEWTAPRFYGLQHQLNAKHVKEAKARNLGGVVCWEISRSLTNDPSHLRSPFVNIDGLDILCVGNLAGLEAGEDSEIDEDLSLEVEVQSPETMAPLVAEE